MVVAVCGNQPLQDTVLCRKERTHSNLCTQLTPCNQSEYFKFTGTIGTVIIINKRIAVLLYHWHGVKDDYQSCSSVLGRMDVALNLNL